LKYQLVKPIIRLKNVPNFKRILNTLPVRAKALKLQSIYKAFALTGRIADCQNTQGAALGYELLPLQGVLLAGAALG